MTTFAAYAAEFEAHPRDGDAFRFLTDLLQKMSRVDFELRVHDPAANQGQIASNFDGELERKVPPKELTPRANSSEVESGKGRSAKGVEVR